MEWITWKGRQIPIAVVTAAGVVLLVPLILWAFNREPPELAENRLRLEQMPALEREQLAVRYAEFSALPREDQAQYRRMHEELEQNPRLQGVLLRYQAWLETLSPWQRDELASTTDAGTRRRLVEKYLAEQDQDLSSRPLRNGRVRGGMSMSEADFQLLLRGMQDSLDLTRDELQQLNSLRPVQRAVAIILRVLQSRRAGSTSWPAAEEISTLRQNLTSQPLQRALNRMQDPRGISQLLLRAAAGHLEASWRERSAEKRPEPEQLASTFSDLTDDEQDQLMRLSSEAQLALLERKYFSQHPELREEAGDLRRLLLQLQPLLQNNSGGRGGGQAGSAASDDDQLPDQRPGGGVRPFADRGPRGPGRNGAEGGGRPGRLRPGRRDQTRPPDRGPRG